MPTPQSVCPPAPLCSRSRRYLRNIMMLRISRRLTMVTIVPRRPCSPAAAMDNGSLLVMTKALSPAVSGAMRPVRYRTVIFSQAARSPCIKGALRRSRLRRTRLTFTPLALITLYIVPTYKATCSRPTAQNLAGMPAISRRCASQARVCLPQAMTAVSSLGRWIRGSRAAVKTTLPIRAI